MLNLFLDETTGIYHFEDFLQSSQAPVVGKTFLIGTGGPWCVQQIKVIEVTKSDRYYAKAVAV